MSRLGEKIKQTKSFESKAQEAMLSLIVAAVEVRDQAERVCREHGLSFSHYNVLRILRGAPAAGYPRCDIIDRMLDPAPDVTRLIDTLVEKGLVKRERSTEDRRRTLHWVTDAGLKLLAEMQQQMADIHARFGERFSESELDELMSLLDRVYAPQVAGVEAS